MNKHSHSMKFYEINILCPTKICDFIIFHPLLELKRSGLYESSTWVFSDQFFLGIIPMGPPFFGSTCGHAWCTLTTKYANVWMGNNICFPFGRKTNYNTFNHPTNQDSSMVCPQTRGWLTPTISSGLKGWVVSCLPWIKLT
jgi:hypothetical protein